MERVGSYNHVKIISAAGYLVGQVSVGVQEGALNYVSKYCALLPDLNIERTWKEHMSSSSSV
jgi:hypothetical protein